METLEKMTSFIENPELYISIPPCVPQMKVCIIGQAFSGCTSQGKILAHTYGLKYISVDECLIEWDNSGNQDELMDNIPIYKKVKFFFLGFNVLCGRLSIDLKVAKI